MFGFYDTYMKLFGLTITYYGLFVALGMAAGVFVAYKLAKLRGFKGEDFLIAACYIIPLAILGARLYYVIFSDQKYTFLEFFQIWKGGLAVYGGVIGGALAVALYCLIHKKNFFKMADIAVVALLLGQGIGRIGCYFGGCCYGIEVTNESMKWFPLSTQIDGVWHYSTFFYESFCCFIFFALFMYLIIKKIKITGVMTGLYLVCYGIARCVIETFRGDSLYIGAVKVSQLLSGLLIAVGVIMILLSLDINKNRESDIDYKSQNKVQKQETATVETQAINIEQSVESETQQNDKTDDEGIKSDTDD